MKKASVKTEVLHYPRLDTVLMIERFIKDHSGEFTKTNLWRALPKGTMYQTFSIVIDYLLHSNKISIDSKGKIGWMYNPKLVKYFLKYGVPAR